MKRFIKLCAFPLMASAMTGCTSNEDLAVPQKADNAIGFKIVSQNMTRAANSFDNNNLPTKLKVTAFDGTTNYFGDIDIATLTDGIYISEHTRYWPVEKDKSLTFYAYIDDNDMAYSTAEVNNSASTFNYDEVATGGNPQFKDYMVDPAVEKQRDLMYAVAKDVKESQNDGTVYLNFQHALSQICFKAKNNDPRIKSITVNSIELHGISGKGTYTFAKTSTSTDTELTSFGKWEIEPVSETNNPVYQIGDISEDSKKINKTITGTTTNSEVVISANEEGLLANVMTLMPQPIEAAIGENDGGAYFILYIDKEFYSTADLSKTAPTKATSNEKVFVPVKIDWKEGTRYTYTFKWNEGGTIDYDYNFSEYNNNPVTDDTELVVEKGPEKVLMIPENDPSGLGPLYFANYNVGATSPDDFGLYFWWGDIEGHRVVKTSEGKYVRDDDFYFEESNPLILSADKPDNELSFVNNNHLSISRDAAHIMWGDNWRMPTREEFVWLTNGIGDDNDDENLKPEESNNCEWILYDASKAMNEGETLAFTDGTVIAERYDVNGCFVQSIFTKNYIFLPLNGFCYRQYFNAWNADEEDGSLPFDGYYWSSNHFENYQRTAYSLDLEASSPYYKPCYYYDRDRYNGIGIRAVYKP